MALPSVISENLIATLSDHLPQFLIAPNIFLNFYTRRYNKQRFFKRKENFIFDCSSIDWDNLLRTSNMNVDNLYKTFIEKFDPVLDTYSPITNILKIR